MNNFFEKGYNGIVDLKRPGVNIEFTAEQAKELMYCASDPLYFCKYVKIRVVDDGELLPFEPYDYQKQVLKVTHENRFVITKFPRQSGKTTIYVAYCLWNILFNRNYVIAILAHKESQAKEILRRIKTAYQALPKWMQHGIRRWNEKDIELENGSIIYVAATSPDAIRGNTPNMVLLDEFAFVSSRIAADFMGSSYPSITSGKTSKICIVSTPNGLNLFYKMWKDATSGKSSYIPLEIGWDDVPGRDEAFKQETIANLPGGAAQWEQEFECVFLGGTNTLISPTKLQAMVDTDPVMIRDDLNIYEFARELRQYVMTVDVAEGVGRDYSAFSVFDVTEFPYRQVATYRNNTITTLEYPNIIFNVAKTYNDAQVLIELNSLGMEVSNILWHDYHYENMLTTESKQFKGTILEMYTGNMRGLKMSKGTKKLGCQTLKHLIENDKLIINDSNTIFELANFVKQESSFAAEDGHNDDLVMTSVAFAWLTAQAQFSLLTSQNVRKQTAPDDSDITVPRFFHFDDSPDENRIVDDFDNDAVWQIVDSKQSF